MTEKVYAIHKESINLGCLEYLQLVKQQISKNQNYINEEVSSRFGKPNNLNKVSFSINGGLLISELKHLGVARDFFLQIEGRYSKKIGFSGEKSKRIVEYNLRGPRFVTALDPSIEFPEKLAIYRDDIFDAIEIISTLKFEEIKSQILELSPMLDYIKNSCITILNSYIQNEKFGSDGIINVDNYFTKRKEIVHATRLATRLYYKSLNNMLSNVDYKEINFDNFGSLTDSLDFLDKEYKKYSISSRSLVRPEASDPRKILASALLLVTNISDAQVIIGLPSGGTEFSCLLAELYKECVAKDIDLVLLPISLHSLKNDYGVKVDSNEVALGHASNYPCIKKAEKILIIDDNSSTGQTVECVRSVIRRINLNSEIYCGIAEADLIRTSIDFDSITRKKIASPEIFRFSSGVLPISRLLKPKSDLKEYSEKRNLIRFYENKKNSTAFINEKLKYSAYISCIEQPLNASSLDDKNAITSFQNTFLSNFYSCDIVYKGQKYPSVEHAYQGAKFNFKSIELDIERRINLQQMLHYRGVGFTVKADNLQELFISASVDAGTIKMVAQHLRSWRLIRPDWDRRRMDVMIELLIKKYHNSSLKKLLSETGSCLLIEGNYWQDTYWGYDLTQFRGRNFLGRLLMLIRELQK